MLLLHNQISKIKRQGSPFLSCTLFVNFWSLLAKCLENWYLPLVQGLLNLDFWFKYYSGYILELNITVNKVNNGFKLFGLWYSYWRMSIVSAVYIFLIQCDYTEPYPHACLNHHFSPKHKFKIYTVHILEHKLKLNWY